MTVKELIEKLKEFNQEAEIVSITVGNMNEWNSTGDPKVTSSKNMFGEKVWIQ